MLLQSVFFIGKDIVERPFRSHFQGLLPNLTTFNGADGAAERHATIGMNEKFDAIAHFLLYNCRERINFSMCLV